MLSDLLRAIGVGLVFMMLLQLLSLVRTYVEIPQEASRKIVHVVMGLITVSFPWVFHHELPVQLLAVSSGLMLLLMKKISSGRRWDSVLCARGRKTYGEIVFPIAVALLFTVTHGQPILYCIPILILTLADTISALVGMTYGKRRYHTADGCKTLEGSLMFFLVSFLSAHIPLLLCTSIGRAEALLVSLILGIIATLFEAIAWRGLDNLFIPMGAYLVLKTHLLLSTDVLTSRLLVIIGLLIAVLVLKRRTTLNGSAILGVALYSYYAWVLGGIIYAILPLIVFISYTRLLPQRFRNLKSQHSIYAVVAVGSTGVLWLLCGDKTSPSTFLFPYTLAFATHASIIATAHMAKKHLNRPRLQTIINSTIKSWLLMFVPMIILTGLTTQAIFNTVVAPLCIAIPTIAFFLTRTSRMPMFAYKQPDNVRRWLTQVALVTAGSSVGLLPCFHIAH